MTAAAIGRSTRTAPANRRSRRWRWLLPTLIIAVILAIVGAILIGRVALSVGDLFAMVFGDGADRMAQIAVDTRVPRALLAVLAGTALASAGTLMQALTKNPLASPEIIGVSQGVVAAVVAITAFGPGLSPTSVIWLKPVCGVVGGFSAAFVLYLMSRRIGSTTSEQFILIGILVGGVLAAITFVSLIFLGSDAASVLTFMAGSLALRTWADVGFALIYLVPGLILLAMAVPRANALQLGDELAIAIGQSKRKDQIIVMCSAVLLTAGAVTVVGAIGFVGLMAPHMARSLVGSDLRRLVPAASLLGTLMILVADFVARTVQPRAVLHAVGVDARIGTGYLPVGVYIALFGVPFVISLLWRRR